MIVTWVLDGWCGGEGRGNREIASRNGHQVFNMISVWKGEKELGNGKWKSHLRQLGICPDGHCARADILGKDLDATLPVSVCLYLQAFVSLSLSLLRVLKNYMLRVEMNKDVAGGNELGAQNFKCTSISLSLCLYLCLSVFLCVSVSLCLSLCLSLSLFLS